MVASGRCRCTVPCEVPSPGAVAVDRVDLLAYLLGLLVELTMVTMVFYCLGLGRGAFVLVAVGA